MSGKHKVLLLDDDSAAFLVYKRKFEDEFGDEVQLIHCEHFADLEDMLAETQPSTVILDQRLHNGNTGLDAVPTIRRTSPRSQVILNSAYGNEQLAAEAVAAGIDGYVMGNKEDIDLLMEIVRSTLENAEKVSDAKREYIVKRERLRHLCETQRKYAQMKFNQSS